MNAPAPPSNPPPRVAESRLTIAIDGLPDALARLVPSQVHIVYASASPARDALFWNTAAAALTSGPVNVLSTRHAVQIVEGLVNSGVDLDGRGAIHAKANLCTLRPLPERDGAEVLLEALKALSDQCAQPGSAFLIDGADEFFTWHDPNALARQGVQLASWCEQSAHTVLLLATPPDFAQRHAGSGTGSLSSASAGLHGRFAGAAELHQVHGQFVWEVAFWGDQGRMLGAEALPLRFSASDGRLMVASGTFGNSVDEAGHLAPDEARVIVSREAVADERILPRNWEIVEDNDAVIVAASSAIAATVLLAYDITEQLESLAGQVYTLRRECGSALKIAIRERRVSMRYQAVMRSLGTNLVIPRDTPIARVESLLDDLQGQVFSRPLPADYMSALSAVLHSSEIGYVTAQRFADLVRETVDRARAINLPNVLLRLPLLPEVAHVDALEACRMNRAGDLCTACGDSLYTYFFSCRLADVETVLQRVFLLPPSDLFRGELRCGDPPSILTMLETLERDLIDEPPLDYSTWLSQRHDAGIAGAAAEPGTPSPDAEDTGVAGVRAPEAGAEANSPNGPVAASGTAAVLRAAPTVATLPLKLAS